MKRIQIIIAFLLITWQAKSQNMLTMQEIQSAIETNHPALKMLDAEANSLNEAAKGAYSWMPTDLGAGVFLLPYNPAQWLDQNGTPGRGMFMISAQQMFPNRKKQHSEYDYMRAKSSIAHQKKEVVVNDLIYIARKNLYEWIVIEKKWKVLEENKRLLQFMMQSTEIRYKNGLGKISAYYKSQAALANVENMMLVLKNEIAEKKIAINTVMNRSRDEDFLIDTNIVWFDFDQSMFDSNSLMNRKSEIKVIDRAIQVNNLARSAELAKLKPEFGIKYDHMTRWTGRPMQFSLMGMMRLPLLGKSTLMNEANASSLLLENEALENQQQVYINEVEGFARSSLVELELKKNQMKLYEEQIIPALRRNFQTMQLGYEQNTEDLFQLFDSWEALNMTQIDYFDQLQKGLQMQAELMKILEIKQND